MCMIVCICMYIHLGDNSTKNHNTSTDNGRAVLAVENVIITIYIYSSENSGNQTLVAVKNTTNNNPNTTVGVLSFMYPYKIAPPW